MKLPKRQKVESANKWVPGSVSSMAGYKVHLHTHLLCHWRKESVGGDSGWPQLIHHSSASDRRSGLYPLPTLWHSLPALPDNELRKGKLDVNTVTQMAGDGEGGKRGGNNREEQMQREKIYSICTSLEREPFRIRYLKRPSFSRNSSHGHNKGGRDRRGCSKIKGVRQKFITTQQIKSITVKNVFSWLKS